MDYCLTTFGLTKSYRKTKALDGLTMRVPEGEIYGLVGKNGAGKTTFFRVICGLQSADAGTYSLYGIENTDKNIRQSRKRVGAMIGDPALYGNMTAEENMKMQYIQLGISSFADINEILACVGLSETGKKKVRNYSRGMKQRLGIALALAGHPDLILLDEPVNGLDPQGIVEIRELILKLNQERNITFVISSHLLNELSRLATCYGFVDKGRIIKEISAEELEMECRKCKVISVNKTEALIPVLDNAHIEYRVITDTEAEIYGDVSVSKLCTLLAQNGIELLNSVEKDEDLESYFINLVGGEGNA